jgi:hypothetical protein
MRGGKYIIDLGLGHIQPIKALEQHFDAELRISVAFNFRLCEYLQSVGI